MGDWQSVKAENLVRHTSGIYYLRARIGGKIIRRSLRTEKLRIAKIKRDTLLLELRAKAGAIRNQSEMNLAEAMALTKSHYSTLPTYIEKPKSMQHRNDMLKIIGDTLPNTKLSTWKALQLKDWWQSPCITKYAATTRNGLLGTVRKMMELAIQAHARIDDPSADLKRIPVRTKEITIPTRNQLRSIVADIRKQNKRVSEESANYVEFLAYSGMRISEAQAIKWHHVSEKAILVTGGKKGTKNHEQRRVPIIPPMAALLERMRSNNNEGALWSIQQPRFALTNACKRLKIEHVRIHNLRHLFATACIESGVDIPTLSRWLGHKDGGVLALKTYGHLRDEHSQREAAKVTF